jgi:hypothetical protein
LNANDLSPIEIESKKIAGVVFPLNSTGSSNTPPNNSKFKKSRNNFDSFPNKNFHFLVSAGNG